MAYDKLVDSTQLDSNLTSVANAIRTKGGTSETLAFPSGYVNAVNALPQMTGNLAFLGKDAELVSENFYSKVDYLKNTNWHGWAPSTTAKTLVSSVTLSNNKFTATDVDVWCYYMVWECGLDVAYTGTPTQNALPLMARAYLVQGLIKRPSSWDNIVSVNCNGTVNQNIYTSSFLRYYGTTTGTITYTWAASNGFYFGITSPAISSATVTSPAITPKTPTFSAKVNASYMTAANAELVDEDNSKWWIKGTKIYRAKHETMFDGVYRSVCQFINAAAPTA